MGIGLGERKGALIIRARALDYKARSLAQNREDWANGFKELKREISYLFRDMASLNDDLKVRKHAEIAPTTFVQEVVRIILLVAKKQISVEEARLQSIALTPALRAISTHSDLNETSDRSSGIKSEVGAATDVHLRDVASLDPESIVKEKNADQAICINTRDRDGNGQSEPQREEVEEDRQMQELQNIKEEEIDRKTADGIPGPMPKKYVDDKNEVQESKEPTIQGPSLVACERCVKYGRQCLAFNTTRRSVCSNCRQQRVRCSNSRKSMKQAAMGEKTGDHKPHPGATPKSRRTVGPRRQVLSRRVEELEQVIEELRAEVVKRERNDQLEDAILTMSNFIQQHTASLDARLQIEQATAQRLRSLEVTLLAAGLPIPAPLVPDAGIASRTRNDAPPISSKSVPSLPSTSTDPQRGVLLLPLHHVQGGRKRVGSEVLSIPKRARSE